MEKNNLKNFLQSILKKIRNNSLIKNEQFSGKEILEYTDNYQVNLFILKNIFIEWEQSIEKNKSSYFNYDNEEVRCIYREYSNILSKNISINNNQINDLAIDAIQDYILLILKPYEFFTKEFEKFENKISIKKIKIRKKYYKINGGIYSHIIDEMKTKNKKNINKTEILTVLKSNQIELIDHEKNIAMLKTKLDLDLEKYLNLIQNKKTISSQSTDILELFGNNEKELNQAIESAKSKDDFKSSSEFLIKNYGEKYNWDLNDRKLSFLLKDIYRHHKSSSS